MSYFALPSRQSGFLMEETQSMLQGMAEGQGDQWRIDIQVSLSQVWLITPSLLELS